MQFNLPGLINNEPLLEFSFISLASFTLIFLALFMTETADQMIVYQSGSLWVGIDDDGAQEPETALFQVLADAVG